jgi:hypothetical protein
MADNFTGNPGTGGDTFAANDISGTKYARIKISSGRAGVVSDVGTGFRLISAASTNGTSLKASAGTLYVLYAINTNAAVRYIKFYNKASAPTVGTDTPVATFAVPASTTGAGFSIRFRHGCSSS